MARLAHAFGLLVVAACSREIELGFDRASIGPDGAGGTTSSDAAPCQIQTCQGKTYACGDCIDNDGDGLIDSQDPECLGPCDNTEESYFGGIPGQNKAPCKQDCYFDQDTGSGNDDCYWDQQCDAHGVPPDYPPSGDSRCATDEAAVSPSCDTLRTTQSTKCLDFCLPLTPNGCDCFGCCEIPPGSGNNVWLGSTFNGAGSCDAAHVSDPQYCKPCERVASCFNSCDPCEVCVGRTAPDPSCGQPSESQCPSGRAPCGLAGQAPCAADQYCVTGCCVPVAVVY